MASRMKTTIRPKYLVLTANMIDPEFADRLEATAKTLATPAQAATFAQHEGDGWAHLVLDERTSLLSHRGIDVAMFFQRQFIKYQPAEEGPVEHAPAKTLKNEDEAWMRISLLETKSALKQAQFFTKEFEQATAEAKQYKGLAESRSREIELLNLKISQMEKQIEESKQQKVKA